MASSLSSAYCRYHKDFGSGNFLEKIFQKNSLDLELTIDLAPEVTDILTKWVSESKSINILIAGRTGTGKSTLINAIVGKDLAKVGKKLTPETSKVNIHEYDIQGITVRLFDTPGLQDGSDKESEYIAEIQKEYSRVDLFLYCIRMSETRFFPGCPDAIAISRLSQAVGERLWKNGLILFTFANDVVNMAETKRKETTPYFRNWMEKLSKKFKSFLQEDVKLKPEVVENLSIIPVGHANKPFLPSMDPSSSNDIHWLSNFWLKALRKSTHDSQPALIKLNYHRLATKPKEYTLEELLDTASDVNGIQLIILSQKGADVCKELGDNYARIGSVIGKQVTEVVSKEGMTRLIMISLANEHGIVIF